MEFRSESTSEATQEVKQTSLWDASHDAMYVFQSSVPRCVGKVETMSQAWFA
jgi:hypothetical protein